MRAILAACVTTILVACGGTVDDGGGNDTNPNPDACVGLECNVVKCEQMGKQPTALTGTVFAPNGTLPLYGIDVYVPRDQPPPLPDGLTCDRCGTSIPGAVATAKSDEMGNFRLENVPSGANVPLVIQTGKWRREITIANIADCQDNIIAPTETRLPRNKMEGNIPKIALTTGDADSLECLLRKLGIADSELTSPAGGGRIHFYRGDGVSNGLGHTYPAASPWWDDVNNLKAYDIVFLSCEGSQIQNGAPKSQNALNAMKAYADAGGRVFASHWHNIWIGGNFQNNNPGLAPPVWNTVATWRSNDGNPGNPILIDEAGHGKGPSFATWMMNVMGSTMRGEIQLTANTGRATSVTLDAGRAERWVYSQGMTPQMFQFFTPQEVPDDQRCGKVVFTDMHVTGTSDVGNPFPDSCPGGANNLMLTPQEKALAFMFFDIASCVGGIF